MRLGRVVSMPGPGEPGKLSQRPVDPGLLPMGAQKVGDTCAKAPQVPNAQTTLGHCLLRYVIPTRDLRSPNGATGNSQGRKPLVIEQFLRGAL